MKRFVLLEWVGRWSPAGCGTERAPLFETPEDAQIWVRDEFLWESDPPGELERAMTRYRCVEIALPVKLYPVNTPEGKWSGMYSETEGGES